MSWQSHIVGITSVAVVLSRKYWLDTRSVDLPPVPYDPMQQSPT